MAERGRAVISQRSIDLIVSFEVSSKAYYEAHYRHPEWPGGASGVTIAIGYDLGYADKAKLHGDWSGRVSDAMLRVMERCLGVKGDAASALLPSVRSFIDIPWDKAMAVFTGRDVPQWTAAVCQAIPGADNLSADCLGALVSLAYNRGASFNLAGDRYAEMRQIKSHVVSGNLAAVPNDIRGMKRLWPAVKGLRDRREAEAKLFEDGLRVVGIQPHDIPPPPDVEPVSPKPKPQLQPKHAGIGALILGAIAAVSQFWTDHHIAVLAGLGVAVAGVIAYLIIKRKG